LRWAIADTPWGVSGGQDGEDRKAGFVRTTLSPANVRRRTRHDSGNTEKQPPEKPEGQNEEIPDEKVHAVEVAR